MLAEYGVYRYWSQGHEPVTRRWTMVLLTLLRGVGRRRSELRDEKEDNEVYPVCASALPTYLPLALSAGCP